MSEGSLEKYYRRRGDWIKSQGGVCVVCGSSGNLEIDHINPDDKTYSISEILAGGAEEVVQAELKKCQPLCHDCHKAKTELESGHRWFTHGTRSMYNKHGCRCVKCRQWNSARVKKQRQAPLV